MVSTIQSGKTNWQRVRKLFNDIHLWLGLSSGLIVILICFSGTIYVYNTELTEMAAPNLYKVEAGVHTQKIAPELLIENVEEVSGAQVTGISIPNDRFRTYQFQTKKKDDKSRGITYMVNPYTGAIVGNSNEKTGTKEFMSTMFSLHRWLLLDKIEKPIFQSVSNRELGSKITGWTTIIFTLGCITGLIIWFPQKLRTWRQGLKVKFSGNWKRTNHDLHNSLAFYALIFLLLMGLTGPQWSFEWYRNGLQKTLGVYKPKENQSKESKNTAPEKPGPEQAALVHVPAIQLSEIITIADKELTYTGDYNIQFPQEANTAFNVSKVRTGFFAPAAADRLTIDQLSGKVVKKDIFRNKKFNERVAGSIKAIHVGNVYGKFTKLLYFLACLIATSLPVTGTLIWVNKLKQKKRKRRFTTQRDDKLVLAS